MSQGGDGGCEWGDRVSAMIDGELPELQRELVASHTRTCERCRDIVHGDGAFVTANRSDVQARLDGLLTVLPTRASRRGRFVLALVGLVILVGSAPDFVRGNTSGNSLHDLRHLAIWQASIGVGVMSAAMTFRLSRLITVILGTFLLLTSVAGTYDAATGHRGPWTDPLHIVEILAVLLLLRLVWPQFHFTRTSKRRPPSRSTTSIDS